MAREKRELGLLALESAINRARKAQTETDEIAFFASVAEAVWWLTMLDEALRTTHSDGVDYETARNSETGDLFPGLRYARNRQVHDTRVAGMQGNPLLAGNQAGNIEWRWRSLEAGGVPRFKRRGRRGGAGERAYRESVAGREIVPTLEDAARFLESWIGKVHPELLQRRDTR